MRLVAAGCPPWEAYLMVFSISSAQLTLKYFKSRNLVLISWITIACLWLRSFILSCCSLCPCHVCYWTTDVLICNWKIGFIILLLYVGRNILFIYFFVGWTLELLQVTVGLLELWWWSSEVEWWLTSSRGSASVPAVTSGKEQLLLQTHQFTPASGLLLDQADSCRRRMF